jgi:hypothetical protein
MKPLSIERMREMADTSELDVDDEELKRLLPMVRDLLDVARRLRGPRGGRLTKQPG